jgi:hypothetical protein
MSRTQLSGEELAKLTSQIVRAFCDKNPFEASELPGVIAAVAQALQELNSAAPAERAALVADRSRASVLRGLELPLCGVHAGEIRSTIHQSPEAERVLLGPRGGP